MERLTERERNIDGTGIAKEEITDGLLKSFADKILTKLAEYEDLEEQGLLLKLPCKVGDSVFIISGENICGRKIKSIKILSTTIEFSTSSIIFYKESFGETVFLTRAEATKKLKETSYEKSSIN